MAPVQTIMASCALCPTIERSTLWLLNCESYRLDCKPQAGRWYFAMLSSTLCRPERWGEGAVSTPYPLNPIFKNLSSFEVRHQRPPSPGAHRPSHTPTFFLTCLRDCGSSLESLGANNLNSFAPTPSFLPDQAPDLISLLPHVCPGLHLGS